MTLSLKVLVKPHLNGPLYHFQSSPILIPYAFEYGAWQCVGGVCVPLMRAWASLNSTRTTMARQSCQHVPTEIEYLFTRLARDTVSFLYRSALVQFVEDSGRARLGL